VSTLLRRFRHSLSVTIPWRPLFDLLITNHFPRQVSWCSFHTLLHLSWKLPWLEEGSLETKKRAFPPPFFFFFLSQSAEGNSYWYAPKTLQFKEVSVQHCN